MEKKTAYMIVDGSYDYEIRAAGVAGKVCIDGEPVMFDFKRALVELKDSTEAEFKAVIKGLKLIEKKVGQGVCVEHIVIGTDSLNLIGIMDPSVIKEKFPRAVNKIPPVKQYKAMVNEIKHIILNLGISVEYKKIKAHVENNKATVLEQIHNQVDFMANDAMQASRRSIRKHNKTNNLSYSIIIPSREVLSDVEAKDLRKVGFTMAKRGYQARISGIDDESNPIVEGINLFKEQNKTPFMSNNLAVFCKPLSMKQPQLEGLDKSRVRLWCRDVLAKDSMEMYFDENDLKKSNAKMQGSIIRMLNGSAKLTSKKEYGISKNEESVMMHVEHDYGMDEKVKSLMSSYFEHHKTKREPIGNIVEVSRQHNCEHSM